MTHEEFALACEQIRPMLVTRYGEDVAQDALLDACKLGPAKFASFDKLRNYLSMRGHGAKHNMYEGAERAAQASQEMQRLHKVERQVKRRGDRQTLDAAIRQFVARHEDADMRAALEAFLFKGESLWSAANLLDATLPRSTRAWKMKQALKTWIK